MKAIQLIIKLNSPLLIAGTHYGDENSRTSLNYIPGSTIKGAVISQYLKNQSLGNDVIQDPDSEARKLFFEEKVIFLNAYPHNKDFPNNARALPVPLSWYIEKVDLERHNEQRNIWDFAVEPADLKQGKNEPRKYFWQAAESYDEQKIRYPLTYPSYLANVHNMSIDPQVKTSGNSTVFRYDVLEGGQTFCSYIISKDDALLNPIMNFVPEGLVFLGGSRNSRYGHTIFDKAVVEDWQEFVNTEDFEDEITITLLSDMILKDAHGEPSFDFSQALKEELQLSLKPSPKRAFVKTGVVGGFNRKWGLPTIQDPVLLKGTSFVYQVDNNLSSTGIFHEILLSGLGDRRSEGFGRIAVNLNLQKSFGSYSPEERKSTSQTLSEESKQLVNRILSKQFEKQVDNAILVFLQKVKVQSKPENSQLNKLRTLARKASRNPAEGKTLLQDLLADLKVKGDAFLQFDRRYLKISDKRISWYAWLQEVIQELDGLKKLDLSDKDCKFLGMEFHPENIKKAEIAFRLVDAVATKAIKTKE